MPYWWIYAAGIVVLLLTSWLWWTKICLGPERVFWGMLEKSLTTRSVTIQTSQTSEQSNIRQLVQMELGTTYRAHSLSTLEQGTTQVKTEIIGTRDADYTRYRSIRTDQKNEQGEPLDVSKIINIWSKSEDRAQSDTQSSGHQLFSQALLGIGLPVGTVPVPVGEVSPQDRENLIRQMREQQVYEVSFDSIRKERKDGKLLYIYDVKIQTIPYVKLMKDFAKQIGLHELDQVDPNAYQTTQPLEVKLIVDAHAKRLAGVDNGQAGYAQQYLGYGLPLKVTLPKSPISSSVLQQRLTEL